MRFLSELGSCCGVAAVTPAAETTPSALTSRQQEEVVGGGIGQGGNSSHAAVVAPAGGLRKVKCSTSRHWKPSLHMISEDGVVVSDMGRTSGVRSDDQKLPAKVKANPRAKVVKPTYHGEDYWKSSALWAIPAFAPAPF